MARDYRHEESAGRLLRSEHVARADKARKLARCEDREAVQAIREARASRAAVVGIASDWSAT